MITGPSKGGLGAETAISLATANPKTIVLAGRNETRIAPVIDEIKRVNPSIEVIFVPLDTSNNSSVRKAADKINSSVKGIDSLINCAGVMGVRPYAVSTDGVESHYATNHLGHFLFTNLLMNKLVAVNGRIVNVTSMAYVLAEANTEDPNFDVSLDHDPSIAQ